MVTIDADVLEALVKDSGTRPTPATTFAQREDVREALDAARADARALRPRAGWEVFETPAVARARSCIGC